MDSYNISKLLLSPVETTVSALPSIGEKAAIICIIAIGGYLLSALVGWIIKKILYRVNLDKRLRKLDLHDSIGDISIAKLTGIIITWWLFAFFLDWAASFLPPSAFAIFLSRMIGWMPSLILGIAIIISGLILIDFIIHRLLELKNRYITILSNIIKVVLIVVVVFTAIDQLGIKTDIAQNIFLMIIGSVLITFSLAFGIGLGLGLKDELKPFIKKYRKKIK